MRGAYQGSGRIETGVSGAELRRRREALGLTQAALADHLGIAATSVARWERGQRRVSNPERVRSVLGHLEAAPPVAQLRSPAPKGVHASLSAGDLPRELTS